MCNKAEILEEMGHTDTALPIREKLAEMYYDNYKCGFFKKTDVGDVMGDPFV